MEGHHWPITSKYSVKNLIKAMFLKHSFKFFDHLIGLLDYGKNHNHDYFGQYCNHDYFNTIMSGPYDQNFIWVTYLKIVIY